MFRQGSLVVLGLVVCAFSFLSISIQPALAQDTSLEEVGDTAGLQETSLPTVIGRIIGVFLSILGIVFLILVIYAGFLWMTAAGDSAKVEKARKILVQAVIGLIITLSAYAITSFVIRSLTGEGIFGGGSGSSSSGSTLSTEPRSNSLGSGGIEDHYPARGATDVSRNTKIYVTFKEAMMLEDIIDGYDDGGTPEDVSDDTVSTTVNADVVQIYPTLSGDDEAFSGEEVSVAFTDDLKTFVFDTPVLGSASDDIQYTVFLSDDIQSAAGDDMIERGGYEWSFTVGTEIDLDPPSVKSVSPASGVYSRNIAVQITFDEAVDPVSATGTYSASDSAANFNNIQVLASDGSVVEGEYTISNAYKTITFVTSDVCGTNSCGETITCLPASDDFTVNVYAATPGESPPQVDIFPFDGIVDMSSNALDGNDDGIAGDDYTWSFSTGSDISLDAPEITAITPEILGEDVALDQDVLVTFDDILLGSSLTSASIAIEQSPEHDMWYKLQTKDYTAEGAEATGGAEAAYTEVELRHGIFLESSDDLTYMYQVTVDSSVKNQYQNCYAPAEGPGRTSGLCGTSDSAPYCCNGTPSSSTCELF